MIYILVALNDELSEAPLDDKKYKIIFTGVGKINAAMHAATAATQPDCEAIINYGSAGALNKKLVGTLSKIKAVRQRDMDARPLADLGETPFDDSALSGEIILGDFDGAILSTGDNFVIAPPEIKSDLVDMEAYAIAKVAKYHNKPITIVKYASDFADDNAAQDWQENCARGKNLFLDWLASNV